MKKYIIIGCAFILALILTMQMFFFLGYYSKTSALEAETNVSSTEAEITYMNKKLVKRHKKAARRVNEVEAYVPKFEDTYELNVSDAEYAELSIGDIVTVYYHNDNKESLCLTAKSAGGQAPKLIAPMILSIFLFIVGVALDAFCIVAILVLKDQAKARRREA